MGVLFGPVPSRRLGRSLGVDLVPYKTCTYDCVYCELGPTTNKTTKRFSYLNTNHVCDQLKKRLIQLEGAVDFITLAGSGEPTLNLNIADLIQGIKAITTIPVAILTNSSLLTDKTMRNELKNADLIVPSLDAVSQDIFKKINLPDDGIISENIVDGLCSFRKEFKGQIWLEVLFCKGINDTPNELKLLKEAIDSINPDRIQINTVFRPPAKSDIYPLSKEEMIKIENYFGDKAKIIGLPLLGNMCITQSRSFNVRLFELLKRRPCTLSNIIDVLGSPAAEVVKTLDIMIKEGKVQIRLHECEKYYFATH